MTPTAKSLEIAKAILADEFTSKKLSYRIALALDAAQSVPKVEESEGELERLACSYTARTYDDDVQTWRRQVAEGFKAGFRAGRGVR